MAQNRCRIGHADRQAQRGRHRLKTRHLAGNAALVIGGGKVGHQRGQAHLGQGAQALGHGQRGLRAETQPVHAGVELEPDAERARQRGGFQQRQLMLAVHRGPDVVFGAGQQFFAIKETFQHHQRSDFSRLAQGNGVFQVEHGKAVSMRQGAHHAGVAMAIAIGLDHRQRLAARGKLLGHGIIVGEGIHMDAGLNRTGHERAGNSHQEWAIIRRLEYTHRQRERP